MSALMSFVRGFAEGGGDILAERARQKREDDIRKQNIVDEMNLYSDKKQIDFEYEKKIELTI